MTIIVTEVSRSGIVMCADSRLSKWNSKKRTMSVYTDEQQKILKFGGIGVSYWGWVSHLALGKDINLWIRREWEKALPSTPGDFARVLAESARLRWNRRRRALGESVGFHVAGYEPWEEGGPAQPVIYHVHNGHGVYGEYKNPDDTLRIVWEAAPPQEIHSIRDFPDGASRNSGIAPDKLLENGWSLRNGDFYITAKVLGGYLGALRRIARVDHYRDAPSHLEARKMLLHNAVELSMRTLKVFSQRGKHVTVGGEPVSESLEWPREKT